MSAQTINLDAPRIPARRDLEADARIDNARRLMRNALTCYDDGHEQAGDVLRQLARLEYARAARLMISQP